MGHSVMYPLTERDRTVILASVSEMCLSACLCINTRISKNFVDKPDNCGLKCIYNLLTIYILKKRFKNTISKTYYLYWKLTLVFEFFITRNLKYNLENF